MVSLAGASAAEEPEGSGSRKARSNRGVSKIHVGRNAHWHITEFDESGDPLSPPIALTKYKTILGLLVKEFIPIKYRKWIGKDDNRWKVPESDKDYIWDVKIQSISLSQQSMTGS